MTRLDGFPARPPSMNALRRGKVVVLAAEGQVIEEYDETERRTGVCSNSLGKFVICRGDILDDLQAAVRRTRWQPP